MAGGHEEEPGFWPGYVAAVSGLVQGLLIMAMALGVAIYAVGQLAKLPKVPAGRMPDEALAAAPTGYAEPVPSAVRPPVVPGLAGPAPAYTPLPALAERISASFQGDAVVLPSSAIPDVISGVQQARDAGARRWRISIPADLTNPREQRAAYLRLLSLRALLVAQGVATGDIDLWIDDGGVNPSASRAARIEPIDARPSLIGAAEGKAEAAL